MNPTFAVNATGILILFFLCLIVIWCIVGSIMFIAGRPGSGVRRVGGSLAFVCGGILLVGILGVGGLVTLKSSSRWIEPTTEQVHSSSYDEVHSLQHPSTSASSPHSMTPDHPDPPGLSVPADAASPVKASISSSTPSTAAAITGQDDRTEVAQRPDWTNQSESIQSDIKLVVISSQQYATRDEANLDATTIAREILRNDLEHVYGVFFADTSFLSEKVIRAVAVKKEYVETVDRDFGSFFAPMHRVWWQVELSPVVRSNLYPLWKSEVQESRVLIVGGSLLAAIVGLTGISLLSRRSKPEPETTSSQAKAAPVVLGVGALALLWQRCKSWKEK